MLPFTFLRSTGLLLTGLTLAAAPARAQAPQPANPPAAPARYYPATSLGLTAGYGAPYGWSVDLGVLVLPQLDLTVGAGFSITGGKVGVGTRYYLTPARAVSPFVGANLAYSTGLNNVTVTVNNRSSTGSYNSAQGEQAVVNFKAASLLHLRSGLRWQVTPGFALLGALGYGVVLGGDAVEYVTASPSQTMRTAVNIFSPGGFEVSAGLAVGLGGR